MKRFALLVCLFLISDQGFAQAQYARRIVPQPALPAVCTAGAGDIVFLTTGNIGMYQCVAANTWSNIGLSGAAKQLNIAQGTLVASTPFLVQSATWNNVGVTFLNSTSTVTDTTSAEGSSLGRFIVGATNVFDLNKNGGITTNQGARTTNNFPAFQSTATFNNAAVTFDNWVGIVTDTASNAASNLLRLGVGANNMFRFQKDGTMEMAAAVEIQPQPLIAGKAQGIKIINPGGADAVFADLGAAANGTIIYCSNCTVANPCAGAGTGAIAKRLNNAWVCN